MDKLQHERRQGDELFSEMVSSIKQHIHESFLLNKRVPKVYEIIADMDYVGMKLCEFLRVVRKVAPESFNRFMDRLTELVRVAKYEYEKELSA